MPGVPPFPAVRRASSRPGKKIHTLPAVPERGMVPRSVAVAAAVAVRPWLWPTVVALAVRMRPDRGWLPPREYLDFRASVLGKPLSEASPAEVVAFLRWCRRFPGRVR